MNDLAIPELIIWIIVIIVLVPRIVKKKRGGSAQKPPAKSAPVKASPFTERQLRQDISGMSGKQHGGKHTHDKLDFDCYDPNESEYEHYRKQLDVLRRAGLMERSEYDELLRRFSASAAYPSK